MRCLGLSCTCDPSLARGRRGSLGQHPLAAAEQAHRRGVRGLSCVPVRLRGELHHGHPPQWRGSMGICQGGYRLRALAPQWMGGNSAEPDAKGRHTCGAHPRYDYGGCTAVVRYGG